MFVNNSGLRRIKSRFAAVVRFAASHRFSVSLTLVALLLAGAIVPLVGQSNRERGEGEHEHDSALQIRKRAEWFFHQRAYPLGHIPAGARLKAFQQVEQMRRTNGFFMDRFAAAAAERIPGFQNIPALSQTQWTSIGPQPTASSFFGNVSGRVNALAVDPCDLSGNTIYLGAAQGGVWKSTDAGANWSQLTDSQPSISSGSLALDPHCASGHTAAIYYGTGEENFAFDSFYGAGVLISHDAGNTWIKDNTFVNVTNGTPPVITPQSLSAAGPFIGAISVDAATSGSSQILLAAVQGISSQAHSGIWRSTDGGADWTLIPPSSYNPALPVQFDFGTNVAFDPNDLSGNTAYAALGIPFCASNTCGAAGDEELDNGVYKSTDSGLTWTRLAGLDTAASSNSGNYGRITIAVGPSAAPSDPTTTELIVSIADITGSSSSLLGCPNSSNGSSPNCASGVFKSNDGGKTFAALSTPAFCNNQCFYDMAVGINPANSNVIFLGGGPAAEGSNSVGALSAQCGQIPANQGISAVIRSTDGGQTWADASCDNASGAFVHVDTHAFAFARSGTFYLGNDGGVWNSTDVANANTQATSQHWTNLNNTLSLTQFYPGNSINPSNPQIGFAGAQDNGMQMFTGQLNWTDTASCGDGAWTAIDPNVPSTVYTTCEAIGNFGTVNKNQMDGTGVGNGVNWIPLDTPAMDSDNTNFIPPMVVDPTQPQNVYFGTFRVWQSATGGLSWSPISLPQCGSSSCVLTTLAVAPNASGTVYAGADTGAIWVSTNATGSAPTFTEINQNNMPQRTVTQVLASPMNSQIAFASFSGFSGFTNPNTNLTDTVGHLFETQNGGGTWTDISCHTSNCLNPLSTDLPNTPVNDVVVDPNDMMNKTLYVATDVGVFMTSNGGGSWIELASGLPHVECTSLKLNNTARVLRVGTHGRGVWDLQLNGLPASALTGISPTSATAGTQGVAPLTLTGQGLPNNPTVMFGTTSLAGSGGGTQVTVSVPASALVNPGVVQVSVASAAPSTGLGFSIEGPVPTLSQISPTSAKTGANITLTVTGSNFNPKSEVVWTPATGTGVNVFVSTVLPQLPGGTSTSFSVTVPASLLASSLAKMVPVAPTAPKSKGPGAFWLLAALCAGIIGILVFAAVPRKRRLIFGTTLTTVLVLLLIGGCSGVGSNNNPPPPPPNSVNVAVDVFNQAPGGGFEPVRQQQTITVSQ